MRQANLALKFLLELAALAGLAVGGASINIAVAILAPVLFILIWGAFCAPRASRRLPTPQRIPLELTLLGLGALGYVKGGPVWAGIAMAVLIAANARLLSLWSQWEN